MTKRLSERQLTALWKSEYERSIRNGDSRAQAIKNAKAAELAQRRAQGLSERQLTAIWNSEYKRNIEAGLSSDEAAQRANEVERAKRRGQDQMND